MSDEYESLVGRYLATKRSVLLSPQFLVNEVREGYSEKWEAWIDFLAIDLSKKGLQVWMVEVTGGSGRAIQTKIEQFQYEYRPRIAAILDKYIALPAVSNRVESTGLPKSPAIGLWVFVTREIIPKLARHADTHITQCAYQATALEDIFLPGTYWERRFHES